MSSKGRETSTIFTIGHSNQPFDEFISLLIRQNIEQLVDVRSKPYSRFHHFNREPLLKRLASKGIDYLYLGNQLGGHPESDDLYANGRVVYDRMAALPGFRQGIKRVANESEKHSLVLMCTEEDPKECHRQPRSSIGVARTWRPSDAPEARWLSPRSCGDDRAIKPPIASL